MLNNDSAFKYETLYKGPFEIMQCWTNGVVALKCGMINIRYNIRHIKPYTYDTTLKKLLCRMVFDNVIILITDYILPCIYIKSWNKVYYWMFTGTITYIHIVHACEVF